MKQLISRIKDFKAQAVVTAFALVLSVSNMAFAAGGLSDSMGTKVDDIIADVISGSVLILGIVGAVVAAKVIFGLFKKA